MSLGEYFIDQSDNEQYSKRQSIEYEEIKKLTEIEREEIREIYKAKGFKGELVEKVVDKITSNKDVWVAEMMKDELNLMEETKSPFKIGVATFVSFLIVGFIPLLVYLWTFLYPATII